MFLKKCEEFSSQLKPHHTATARLWHSECTGIIHRMTLWFHLLGISQVAIKAWMLLPSIPTKMNPQLFEDPQSNNSDSSNDNESDNDSIGSSSQSQEDEAAAGEGEVKPVEKQLPTDSKALLDRRRLFESLKKRREDSVTPLPIGQVGSKTKPMKKQKRVRKPKINPPGNATARPPTTQPRSLPAPREPQRKPMPYLHRVATDPETLDDVTTVRIDLSQQEPLYQGLSKSSLFAFCLWCARDLLRKTSEEPSQLGIWRRRMSSVVILQRIWRTRSASRWPRFSTPAAMPQDALERRRSRLSWSGGMLRLEKVPWGVESSLKWFLVSYSFVSLFRVRQVRAEDEMGEQRKHVACEISSSLFSFPA